MLATGGHDDTKEYRNMGYEHDHDGMLTLGVLGRAMLDFALSQRFSWRLGMSLGYAQVRLASTMCGTTWRGDGIYGFSTGPALKLGSAHTWDVALVVDLVSLPERHCANGGTPPPGVDSIFWPKIHEGGGFLESELLAEPSLAVSARVGYSL